MTTRTDAAERVQRALDEIRAGRMVILVDDEDRENEGDLTMAAELVTTEAVNFMARFGRGLICLPLTEEKVRELDLPMMVSENRTPRGTAFTVSIEARHGISTGISAADRARTIRAAVARDAKPSDIVSPGHVFPLRARAGGVLQRTGHTEGAVDLARLAGLDPAGVICEIMNEDGTMAHRPELEVFAREHGLLILTIADLVQYRLQKESLVQRVSSGPIEVASKAPWVAHVYESNVEAKQFLALTLGEYTEDEVALVRVHTGSVLGDVFGVQTQHRMVAAEAMKHIEQNGRGVILFVPGRIDLRRDFSFHAGEDLPPLSADEQGTVLREFGLGAQVLSHLGLRKIRLLTNRPRRIPALDGYGLEVVEQITLDSKAHS